MFNVVEGKVERVVPALGSTGINRDGSITLNKDIALELPKQSKSSGLTSSSRGFDPKGYRFALRLSTINQSKCKDPFIIAITLWQCLLLITT
jgi:hypothetical protein